jgi:hypothetical protein
VALTYVNAMDERGPFDALRAWPVERMKRLGAALLAGARFVVWTAYAEGRPFSSSKPTG